MILGLRGQLALDKKHLIRVNRLKKGIKTAAYTDWLIVKAIAWYKTNIKSKIDQLLEHSYCEFSSTYNFYERRQRGSHCSILVYFLSARHLS